jgi:transposase
VGTRIFCTTKHWCIPRRRLQVLGETRNPLLFHPPYSPVLAPANIFLIFHIKNSIRRWDSRQFHRFNRLAGELKVIREEACSRAFSSMYARCKHCAEAGGDHIE